MRLVPLLHACQRWFATATQEHPNAWVHQGMLSTTVRLAMLLVMCNAASFERNKGVVLYAQGPEVRVGVPQILNLGCNLVMWVAHYAYRCFMEALAWAYM
jgi:hypothetical protein